MPTGVIYGAKSGIVRRVVCADNGHDLNSHVGEGEALLELSAGSPETKQQLGDIIESAKVEIEKAIGRPIANERHAVIDNTNEVVAIVLVDKELDPAPEGTVLVEVFDERIDVGLVYNQADGTFVIPEKVFPAHIDKDGVAQPERIVDAELITNQIKDAVADSK